MSWIAQNLWLIPVLPLLAAGISALLKRPTRSLAAGLAIGSMGVSFLLSCAALVATLGKHGAASRQVVNFDWFALGDTVVRLGWVLDPLTAAMAMENTANIRPVIVSGFSLKRQKAMKFRFAALSMSSMPIRTRMALRRVSAPARPMLKSSALSRR